MKTFKRFILLCILTSLSAIGNTKDIYVSKTGSNFNDGSKSSPLYDLNAARDLIRHYKQTGQYLNEGFTVWISEGVYVQQESFVLSEFDSGSIDFPIEWKAIPGDDVRISGGIVLDPSKFSKVVNKTILSRLSRLARNHVVQIDLSSYGIKDLGSESQYGHALPVTESSVELVYNDSIMTLSRYPNDGYIKIGKVVDMGSQPRIRDYSNRGGVFHYTDSRHKKWVGEKDVWFQGTFRYGFADDNLPVEYIDTIKGIVKMASPHLYGIEGGAAYQQYYAKNILDELDMPGEYYLDRESLILYFWPPKQINKTDKVYLSQLGDPIICLESVNNISISGLTIECGRGIGIYMENSCNNEIKGCVIRNVGTSGIFMGMGAKQTVPYITHEDYDGVPQSRKVGSLQGHLYKYTIWDRKSGSNNKILSCDVYNTGTGGIYLSGGDKKSLRRGNSVVDNCRIYNYNRRNKFCWAGINVDGCGNTIRHCEIFNSEWQGIYVHGNDHLFEYNEIHHVTLNSNDTSPWYIGRDPSDCGNVIRYNYFHHCGNKDRMNMGIYCDDSSADVKVFGNVFYKMNTTHGVLFSNSGWNLSFENNIVIEPLASTVYISSHYYTWGQSSILPTFSKDGLLNYRLLNQVNIHESPYSERYPFLYNYLDPIIDGKEWEGMRTRGNIAFNNVIVGGPREFIYLDHAYSKCTSISNRYFEKDPGFVDYASENFLLRKDSEVYKLITDFKEIPFDRIGLYNDMYRK